MEKLKTFTYPKSFIQNNNHETGYRTYDVAGVNDAISLPSVTTILGNTKDKSFLDTWKKKVGEEQARKIVQDASARGTSMHHQIEGWISGENHADLTPAGKQAESMAKTIIKNGLEGRIEGYYGIEALMYYPNLYAGSADLICQHEGELTVVDFKQTNKPKQEAWIEDYFMQLAAYSMAHDFVYKTEIDKAMIMMCSVDNYYQEWIISGAQLRDWKHKFLARVDQYYGQIDQGL